MELNDLEKFLKERNDIDHEQNMEFLDTILGAQCLFYTQYQAEEKAFATSFEAVRNVQKSEEKRQNDINTLHRDILNVRKSELKRHKRAILLEKYFNYDVACHIASFLNVEPRRQIQIN